MWLKQREACDSFWDPSLGNTHRAAKSHLGSTLGFNHKNTKTAFSLDGNPRKYPSHLKGSHSVFLTLLFCLTVLYMHGVVVFRKGRRCCVTLLLWLLLLSFVVFKSREACKVGNTYANNPTCSECLQNLTRLLNFTAQ